MKIVDRKTFLQLPIGTVYRKHGFRDTLALKLETFRFREEDEDRIYGDWYYTDLADRIAAHDSAEWSAMIDRAKNEGADIPLDFSISRDGCYETDEHYEVWTAQEVADLVAMLSMSVTQLWKWSK